MNTTESPTIRQALKSLRTSDLPDWMVSATAIILFDGTFLEVFNAPSSCGGYFLGSHVAKRYSRAGKLIATYKI
jgi:hypothetical protein